SSIMTSDAPPLSSLNSAVPSALDHVVTACLAKDADARWQTASDVLLQLKWIAEAGSRAGVPAPVIARRKRHNLALWSALAASVTPPMFLAWLHSSDRPVPPQPAGRFRIPAPVDAGFLSGFDIPVLPPEGGRLVFTATPRAGGRVLCPQPLDTLEAKP